MINLIVLNCLLYVSTYTMPYKVRVFQDSHVLVVYNVDLDVTLRINKFRKLSDNTIIFKVLTQQNVINNCTLRGVYYGK